MIAHEQLVRDYEAGIGVPASGTIPADDPGSCLAAALPVWALAAGSVAAVTAAANRIRDAHHLNPVLHRLDPVRITAAFCSERLLRVGGAPAKVFADLSGFFPTFDGWVRTNANYPHHRARLLASLGLPEDAPVDLAVAQMAMSRAPVISRKTRPRTVPSRCRYVPSGSGRRVRRAKPPLRVRWWRSMPGSTGASSACRSAHRPCSRCAGSGYSISRA